MRCRGDFGGGDSSGSFVVLFVCEYTRDCDEECIIVVVFGVMGFHWYSNSSIGIAIEYLTIDDNRTINMLALL